MFFPIEQDVSNNVSFGFNSGIFINSRITNSCTSDSELRISGFLQIKVKIFTKSHDRFLIIDNTTVYHIGASLKDLGKKWFAFSKIELNASDILSKLNEK